jgi:hypothetical protein
MLKGLVKLLQEPEKVMIGGEQRRDMAGLGKPVIEASTTKTPE